MKKQLEISIIDKTILFNLLQRSGSSQKAKNNFVLYDIGGQKIKEEYGHWINVNEEIQNVLFLKKDATFKLGEMQKILPQDKAELLGKCKRFYNFILLQPEESEFLSIFNTLLGEIYPSSAALISVGSLKVDEEQLIPLLEAKLRTLNLPSNATNHWRIALTLYQVLKNNKINEIHILRSSTADFFQTYPFMNQFFATLNSTSHIVYPNDILNNKLYFGNWKHASNEDVINSVGITHIVNMTSEVENFFASNKRISYLKISIDDEDTSNIIQHFKETYYYIYNALKKPENKVLIHCAQGKSRSGTIVCMFLMRKFKWNYEETLKYVQERRDVACPNYGFAEQLKKFENNGLLFEGETFEEVIDSKVLVDQSLLEEAPHC